MGCADKDPAACEPVDKVCSNQKLAAKTFRAAKLGAVTTSNLGSSDGLTSSASSVCQESSALFRTKQAGVRNRWICSAESVHFRPKMRVHNEIRASLGMQTTSQGGSVWFETNQIWRLKLALKPHISGAIAAFWLLQDLRGPSRFRLVCDRTTALSQRPRTPCSTIPSPLSSAINRSRSRCCWPR